MKKKTWLKFPLALLMAAAAALPVRAESTPWADPCIPAPHDYTYQDDTRFVAVNRVTQPGLTYLVADVQLRDVYGFHVAVSEQGAQTLSSMAEGTGAVLAVNGDDFGSHRYGVIIRNGEVLRAHDTTRHMLILEEDGSMRTLTDRTAQTPVDLAGQLVSENVWHTFEFGPELVRDGQLSDFPRAFDVISTRSSRKEPRTAIGMIAPLHYVVIVVDGRQPGYSEGISLQDLQQLFLDYGAQTALNLDGGGSAEMWFMGEIISSPSGGHERAISDILYF